MSTLTMTKQSRLKLGGKRGNSVRRAKARPARALTGSGQFIMRIFMTLFIISFIAALGVGLLYGYRFITSHPYFEIKKIHITGNDRLTNGDIINCSKVNLGTNCIDMNLGEVKNNLSSNPWIQSVSVRRDLPNRLCISIVEKTPMFWLRQGDGLYFADARGKVIAPMHPGEIASLPVLDNAAADTDGSAVLSGLLEKIDKRQTPFTQAQIAWVKLTSSHEIEIFLDDQDLTLRLSMDQWQIQLERMKTVWRDLMRRDEFKDAAIIAASGDKIWIKKRPAKSQGKLG